MRFYIEKLKSGKKSFNQWFESGKMITIEFDTTIPYVKFANLTKEEQNMLETTISIVNIMNQ
jgi:hypothetical protein